MAGMEKEKVYNYHVLAANRALTAPTPDLTLARLRAVSRGKSEPGALTILHLCGHNWCHNADHYGIGTKVLNDQQTACHRALQSCNSATEVAHGVCHHPVRCWSIVYKGAFADRIGWAVD